MAKVKLQKQKETKGTFLYGADDGPIRSIYVNKSAFKKDAPDEITVDIPEIK